MLSMCCSSFRLKKDLSKLVETKHGRPGTTCGGSWLMSSNDGIDCIFNYPQLPELFDLDKTKPVLEASTSRIY